MRTILNQHQKSNIRYKIDTHQHQHAIPYIDRVANQ